MQKGRQNWRKQTLMGVDVNIIRDREVIGHGICTKCDPEDRRYHVTVSSRVISLIAQLSFEVRPLSSVLMRVKIYGIQHIEYVNFHRTLMMLKLVVLKLKNFSPNCIPYPVNEAAMQGSQPYPNTSRYLADQC